MNSPSNSSDQTESRQRNHPSDQPGEHLRDKAESIEEDDVEKVIDGFEERIAEYRESKGPRKVRRALDRAQLFFEMLKSWWDDEFSLPWKTVTAVTAALLYLINPMDMIPDFITFGGLLDDATMIYIAYQWVESDLLHYVRVSGLDPAEYGFESGDEELSTQS
ncbi:MAG: YkvA family protein [bacterium]